MTIQKIEQDVHKKYVSGELWFHCPNGQFVIQIADCWISMSAHNQLYEKVFDDLMKYHFPGDLLIKLLNYVHITRHLVVVELLEKLIYDREAQIAWRYGEPIPRVYPQEEDLVSPLDAISKTLYRLTELGAIGKIKDFENALKYTAAAFFHEDSPIFFPEYNIVDYNECMDVYVDKEYKSQLFMENDLDNNKIYALLSIINSLHRHLREAVANDVYYYETSCPMCEHIDYIMGKGYDLLDIGIMFTCFACRKDYYIFPISGHAMWDEIEEFLQTHKLSQSPISSQISVL